LLLVLKFLFQYQIDKTFCFNFIYLLIYSLNSDIFIQYVYI